MRTRRWLLPLACSVAGLGLIAPSLLTWSQEPDFSKELPRIKPLEPAAALKSFQLHEGFRLDAIAVEPVVTDPVSACYDADGRLYVVEMRGYPFPEKAPTSHVCRLEDRDGDGRFETRTNFVDGLSWPTGIVPYDNGVFIAVAPDLIYAKDTSGDGVADVKTVMFSGFGTANVQGLVNGLLWGPDGWIYGVSSSNGGIIVNRKLPGEKPVSVRGRDFRFRPDGSAFQAISGGGQFGHSFDDWGHRFTCNNSNHIRQIVLPARYLDRNPALIAPPAILDIAVEGPAAVVFRVSTAEPWRIVRTRQRAADPVLSRRLPKTELFATGFFTSASGITIYRGTAYPPEYRGNVFVGDVGGNLVHRKILAADGVTFQARRADANVEFLASTDHWFRPVNFANTPDGTLLVLDMYRETIEHPLSIPEPIQKHLDLTSGKDRGRLYELIYTGVSRKCRPALSGAPTDQLVKLLADPNCWWRETAQRLIFERQDRSAVGLLGAMVKERPSALARLHALWTLDLLGTLDSAAIRLGLEDPEPRVREQAIRMAESRLPDATELVGALVGLTSDADPMVRFQLAFSLGAAAADPRAMAALATIAARDRADLWFRTAIMSSVAGRAMQLYTALSKQPRFYADRAGQDWLDQIAFLVGFDGKPGESRSLLVDLEASKPGSATLMRVVLSLVRGRQHGGGSLADLRLGASSDRIKAILTDAARIVVSNGPVEARLVAIQLVGVVDAPIARALFLKLLDARQPVAVQLAVVQALAASLDRELARELIGHWKAMSPAVRREVVETVFGRPAVLQVMVDALESRAIGISELDPVRLTQLLGSSDLAIRDRAHKILAVERPTARDRNQLIASYRPAIERAGDRDRGHKVFLKSCATCHQAEGQGIAVGPDLATVANRSPVELLTHILDPNREVTTTFVNYQVALHDGRIVSGIIADESTNSILFRRAEGASDVIARDQIETIASTGMSLMPEGLERALTQGDMADLIAFVRSIHAAPAALPATK
jgi:putative membrane-bound dehydrogenase-like protein